MGNLSAAFRATATVRNSLLASRLCVSLQPLQIRSHVRRALVAQVAVFLQRLVDDVFQLGRHIGIQPNRGSGDRIQYGLKITAELSPRNGNAPVAISYSTAPNENRSVRASSSLARTCSGDM